MYVGVRGLTRTVRARGALLAEAPPLAVTPACSAGVGTRSADEACLSEVGIASLKGPWAPSRARWGCGLLARVGVGGLRGS